VKVPSSRRAGTHVRGGIFFKRERREQKKKRWLSRRRKNYNDAIQKQPRGWPATTQVKGCRFAQGLLSSARPVSQLQTSEPHN